LIPVILVTAYGSEDLAITALREGAASYVPKKSLDRYLPETLEQVYAAAQAGRQQQRLLGCLLRQHTEFILENEPALIPPLVANLQDQLVPLELCDDNTRMRVGIALEEALLNALYHGNLEVSSDLRQDGTQAYY